MKDDIYHKTRNLLSGSERSLAIGKARCTKIELERSQQLRETEAN
jgi:hypothetical protein